MTRPVGALFVGALLLLTAGRAHAQAAPAPPRQGAIRSRTPSRFAPELRADVWQRERRRPGFRLEAGARGPLVLGGKRAEIALLVGYKSEGYLADAPRRAGALASAAMVVPF